MASSRRGRKRKRAGGGHADGHVDEAWLVSYADMMTLLVALFMVLFSISSVNISKFESLQRAMRDAFSGRVVPGGQAVKETGGSTKVDDVGEANPDANLEPYVGPRSKEEQRAQARHEEDQLRKLQRRLQRIARELGLASKVKVKLGANGLVVRLLTDDLLFDSGRAHPNPESYKLLARLGQALTALRSHPVLVEGHTDDKPMSDSQFPTNWELSTARAAAIARALMAGGVKPERLTASGRAYFEPMASNATPGGRGLNRRVELLLPRLATAAAAGSADGHDRVASIRPPRPAIKPAGPPPIIPAGAPGAPAATPTPDAHR